LNIQSIDRGAAVLITGGTGLVGRALTSILSDRGFSNIISAGSKDCDLRDGQAVKNLFAKVKPQYVFHLAARVYGIGGNNKYKADILYDNVMINTNVLEYARKNGVKKIVAMGSGCVYPELKGQQELYEDQIWIGPPHPSEDSYAHSKRLMLAQLQAMKEQDGISSAFAISGNLYGPHDNFDKNDGHVTPSLIAKFYEASQSGQSVKVWGSGVAIRDFTYCEDAATALYEIMLKVEGPVNLGSGYRHSIGDIVAALQTICGESVKVEWDSSKPDGQLVRYYNLDRLKETGFTANVPLADGVKKTYEWYVNNFKIARK
jgi:GDP-L-fucose synthase